MHALEGTAPAPTVSHHCHSARCRVPPPRHLHVPYWGQCSSLGTARLLLPRAECSQARPPAGRVPISPTCQEHHLPCSCCHLAPAEQAGHYGAPRSGASPQPQAAPTRVPLVPRSKRKVLGRKEPGDTFSSRPTSHSPVKTSGSPAGESLAAVGSSGKSSSRNEDFKALLQKKSSKTSPGTRPSAAELLKTTNPLARRVITEFAPELDGANSPKSQP